MVKTIEQIRRELNRTQRDVNNQIRDLERERRKIYGLQRRIDRAPTRSPLSTTVNDTECIITFQRGTFLREPSSPPRPDTTTPPVVTRPMGRGVAPLPPSPSRWVGRGTMLGRGARSVSPPPPGHRTILVAEPPTTSAAAAEAPPTPFEDAASDDGAKTPPPPTDAAADDAPTDAAAGDAPADAAVDAPQTSSPPDDAALAEPSTPPRPRGKRGRGRKLYRKEK